MFQFKDGEMYQMPVHFGPVCGPRRVYTGERAYKLGSQETEQHTLVYETEASTIEQFLPMGFSVRKPYIIVTHKMHSNLAWLAGRGYNVVTFNVPVYYEGKEEHITGQYQLAIWENHADPIITGREQIGYSKIFASIENLDVPNGKNTAGLESWGFNFCNLSFDYTQAPEDIELLQEIIADPENEGLLHYKYIPKSTDGFCEADVEYVTISPKKFVAPADAKPLPENPPRTWFNGSIEWHIPTWEDMPTQYHIVQGLASLPIKKIIGASRMTAKHYNDVYNQRVVK